MHILGAVALSCWLMLGEMAPYLLFGFLVAGVLSVFVRPPTVERHLGGRGMGPVIKAALFGVPLPLCSCGVIPVATSLRQHGASRGATTSFLLSTPQTGVDSILVTYSLMGLVFAVIRPVAALITGLVGGWLVDRYAGDEPGVGVSAGAHGAEEYGASQSGRNRWLKVLHYGFVVLPRDLATALMVGVMVAGFIAVAIPDDFFAPVLGSGVIGMLVMLAVGIPMYVCATGSVPIAAALMAKGISPGAALVFLMTGPATNAATIATLWKVMGARTTVLYLLAVAMCSLGFGLVLDSMLLGSASLSLHHYGHGGLPGWVKHAGAVLLLALLAWAWLIPARKTVWRHNARAGVGTVRLHVAGMTCGHCVHSVERLLRECPGVSSVEVDLKTGLAAVRGTDLDGEALASAVRTLGYQAQRHV